MTVFVLIEFNWDSWELIGVVDTEKKAKRWFGRPPKNAGWSREYQKHKVR